MARSIFLTILVIGLLTMTGCQTPEEIPETNTPVTVGYSALRISLPVFVADNQGYFAEEGLQVTLERFDTAQPLMQALVAGTIDVGGFTALPITYNSMLRSGKDLYFVTAMMEDQEHLVSYFLVPSQTSEEMTIPDLAGKSIGVLPTVAYQKWLEVILMENGLTVDDVTVVPIAPTLQPAALESGQVDALFTNDPAATTAIQNGIARKLSGEALVPKYLGEPFIFGSFNIEKSFADANPGVTDKVVRALDKAAMFVNENPSEAKQIMKNYLHESQQPFVDAYPDASYRMTALVTDADFQSVSDQYLQIGIITEPLDITGLVK